MEDPGKERTYVAIRKAGHNRNERNDRHALFEARRRSPRPRMASGCRDQAVSSRSITRGRRLHRGARGVLAACGFSTRTTPLPAPLTLKPTRSFRDRSTCPS
jgi:hypothetical protein